MKLIHTHAAPAPGGHYSQAVTHQGTIFVSGQLPIDTATGSIKADVSIEEQTRLALSNVVAILRAAGSDLDLILKTTVYIPDVELWERVNRAYAEFFGGHRPARAIVPSRNLHHGALIEIEAIAAVNPGSG